MRSKKNKVPDKNTQPSKTVELKRLKTKAWAWASAYSLSETEEPLKAYSLSKAADSFAIRNNLAANNDQKNWDLRLEGTQGASEANVKKLWPQLNGIYLIGPWEDGFDVCGRDHKQGGFVPLWSAIKENSYDKILEYWNEISYRNWMDWAPLITTPNDGEMKNGEYIPMRGNCRNIIDLEKILLKLAQAKDSVPPLLSLAATLTVAKIHKDDIVFLFEPSDSAATSTHPAHLREQTLEHLKKINITLNEIKTITRRYGLIIIDCALLQKQEYENLRYTHFTDRPSAFIGDDSITPVIYTKPLQEFSNNGQNHQPETDGTIL